MATFNFQAKTMEGKFVKGEVEAGSETEARVKIRAQKLMPLKVVTKGGTPLNLNIKLFEDSVKSKDLQVFTRQFAVLISAGVPVVQSLQALIGSARSSGMANAIRKIVDEVERGKRLGDALGSQPKVFDRMYVNLVRAGEEGGVLDTILVRLADYIEKSVKMRAKIVGALFYPAAIVVVATLVVAGILIFVIPNFVKVFQGAHMQLPMMTVFVITASNTLARYWYIILAIFVGIPFGIRAYYRTEDGRKVLDPILLKIPVFGTLIQKSSVARMCRTLATLLAAGVRIMEALDIAGQTCGNWVIEKAMIDCREAVSKGRSLAEPLRKVKAVPNMVTQMISIGEQTGNLDQMLSKVADFFEDEVDVAADALTSMIEPLLMVFLGGIIAVIVIAMYLPIFNMASAVGA
jgi:type IV pilus assembly protein PilC